MTTRILVVKLAALGDVIMASTLVAGVRAEWSDAELTWVTGRGAAPIVRLMRGIDHVVEIDDRGLLGAGRIRGAIEMLKVWRAIGGGFDVALVAHTDARYELLVKTSGAKSVRRFANERGPRAERWHGMEYLRLISESAASNAALRMPPLKEELVPDVTSLVGTAPFVVVAPGGGRNVLRDDPLRRWPVESWKSVVQTLVERGHRVVCIGGPDDTVEGAACALVGAIDLTGRTSLLELFALTRRAAIVVTHDAGPLHLAVMAGTPVIALFGPTRSEERIPVWANAVVLNSVSGLACAPCYDGRNYAPCALNLCLTRVSPLAVVQAVEAQLAAIALAYAIPTFGSRTR